jgi:hypothetical protein
MYLLPSVQYAYTLQHHVEKHTHVLLLLQILQITDLYSFKF